MFGSLMIGAVLPQHLPGVLHSLEPALNNYGYLAVVMFVLLEDFGVPVPGETILILGAVYAGTGRLNVLLVGLLAFIAAVIGDNIGFAIGHLGGRRLVERFGRYILLTPERLDKATGFFKRHGGKIVVVARFIEGLRQANGIIAGITGMHWALSRLQRARRCAVGSRLDQHRLLLRQPHQHDLQHRHPLLHLPRDRRRRSPARLHRPANLEATTKTGNRCNLSPTTKRFPRQTRIAAVSDDVEPARQPASCPGSAPGSRPHSPTSAVQRAEGRARRIASSWRVQLQAQTLNAAACRGPAGSDPGSCFGAVGAVTAVPAHALAMDEQQPPRRPVRGLLVGPGNAGAMAHCAGLERG